MGGKVQSSIESRIWAKVEPTGFCWYWTASTDKKGYGYIAKPGGGSAMAHRAAYEILVGPIPEDHDLDHLCRNTSCVNPDHLEPVPHGENCVRGYGFGGVNARKTVCPKGHEYNEDNTYVSKDGWRQCEQCRTDYRRGRKDAHREYMRAYRERKRAEAA